MLLEGEGAEVLQDPLRTAILEVWTDANTGGADMPLDVPASTADTGEQGHSAAMPNAQRGRLSRSA